MQVDYHSYQIRDEIENKSVLGTVWNFAIAIVRVSRSTRPFFLKVPCGLQFQSQIKGYSRMTSSKIRKLLITLPTAWRHGVTQIRCSFSPVTVLSFYSHLGATEKDNAIMRDSGMWKGSIITMLCEKYLLGKGNLQMRVIKGFCQWQSKH